MEAVIDASALIAVIANKLEKAMLIQLTKGVHLIAPHSINWEIGNAFSAMLKKSRITLDQAIQAVELYQHIPIRFVEVELDQSIQIAATLKIYAYDAYLIRCAAKYKVPLLSLDRNLVNSAKVFNVQVLEVKI
jgi:predicted nucleic acid-binding protein